MWTIPDPITPDLKKQKLSIAHGDAGLKPAAPRHLEDDFLVGEELGRGRFGVVRLCRERKTGMHWACKSLRKSDYSRQEGVDDAWTEVELMNLVNGHPNVVGLKAVYEDRTAIHLVMDLCQGGELYDLINAVESFSEHDAAAIFTQLTQAVAFSHAMGVIHRDIKPENILLVDPPRLRSHWQRASSASMVDDLECRSCSCSEGLGDVRVMLADFGLGLVLEPDEVLQGVAGSVLYVAPEVLNGFYNHAADVWSLGVILYILLCGSAPFCEQTEEETMSRIKAGNVAFAEPEWRSVSKEAKDLVHRMLCLNVRKRLTAEEILKHPWIRKNVAARTALQQPMFEQPNTSLSLACWSPGSTWFTGFNSRDFVGDTIDSLVPFPPYPPPSSAKRSSPSPRRLRLSPLRPSSSPASSSIVQEVEIDHILQHSAACEDLTLVNTAAPPFHFRSMTCAV